MNDTLSEVWEAFGKFARSEILPRALQADLDRDGDFARAVWGRARELGLAGLLVPEACGGAGLGPGVAARFLDTAASRCAGVASVFAHHFAAVSALLEAGVEGREEDLKRLAAADSETPPIATVLFPAPGDPHRFRVLERGSRPVLEGECAVAGSAALAEVFCLFAREEADSGGVSCLLLNRNTPGLAFGEPADLSGLKVNPFLPVRAREVEVRDPWWVGERGRAGQAMERSMGLFYGFIAAMAMGLGRDAFERAHAYAGERYQFGRIILGHQEIRRMLGVMRMKLQVGTAAYRSFFQEPAGTEGSEILSQASLVKAYCTDAGLEIALDAVQVHGGYGYMHAYGVEKLMRDAKVLQLLGDSNPALHIRSIDSQGPERL